MSDMSVQPTGVQQPKKMSPVKKGALIGAGLKVATETIGTGVLLKKLGKDTFVKETKMTFGSMGKYAGMVALGLALWTAVGAGIGKIVENSQNKKAQKAQNEVQEA